MLKEKQQPTIEDTRKKIQRMKIRQAKREALAKLENKTTLF